MFVGHFDSLSCGYCKQPSSPLERLNKQPYALLD